MFEPTIIITYPRAKDEAKFESNKTILDAIVNSFNQYPIDHEPPKSYC